jgi:hypothetical protein
VEAAAAVQPRVAVDGACDPPLNAQSLFGRAMLEVHIQSYFSIETDLANEMRSWPEFTSGSGYAV